MSRQDASCFSQCESQDPIAAGRCRTDTNVAWRRVSVGHGGEKQNSYSTLFTRTQARRAAVRRDLLLKEYSSKISDEKWVSELEQIVLRARAVSVSNSESPPVATLDEAAAKLHAVLAQPSYLPEMPIRDLELRQEAVVEDSVKQMKEDEERFSSIVRLRAKKSSLLPKRL